MKDGALPKKSDYELITINIHVELLGYLNKLGKRVFEKDSSKHPTLQDGFESITNDVIHMGLRMLSCETKKAIGLDLDD